MSQISSQQRHGLELEVMDEDKLSCRLTRIRHQGVALPDFEALQAKAERLMETVTYLEDRFRLVEQEPSMILLRSEAPRQQPESVEYYEVRLEAGGQVEIGCCHYDREQTELKAQDMVLSHRQLERLGQDLERIGAAKV